MLTSNSKGNINNSKGNKSKKCHLQFKKKHKTQFFYNSKGNRVATLKVTKMEDLNPPFYTSIYDKITKMFIKYLFHTHLLPP